MIVTLLGIVGMLSLVICYILMLGKKLKADSYKFLFGNLLGAICLMVNGFVSGILVAYPILNVVWIIGTLIQIFRKWKNEKGLRCKYCGAKAVNYVDNGYYCQWCGLKQP